MKFDQALPTRYNYITTLLTKLFFINSLFILVRKHLSSEILSMHIKNMSI